MMRRGEWIAAIIIDGELIDVLDPEDNCYPMYPSDRCGGCDECLIMQAEYGRPESIWWLPKNPDFTRFNYGPVTQSG